MKNLFMKYLEKTIEYGLYLLVFLLPIQTRWIIKAGEINGGYGEYLTYSLYGTDVLLVLILVLYIIVIPALEPESRGKTHKLSFFKKIFLNIINVYNIVIPTVRSWIPACAGMTEERLLRPEYGARNDRNESAPRNNRMVWWFVGGLLLISAISVFFSFNKPLALYKLGWLVLGIGLFWLVVSANYDRLKLVYAMLAGMFFQAGLGIWQFLFQSSFASKWLGLAFHNGADLGTSVIEAVGADGVGERWLRAYGGTDHPNILGGVMAVVIILLIYLILIDENSFRISNFEFRISNKIPRSPDVQSGFRQYRRNCVRDKQNAKSNSIKFLTSYFLLLTFSAALFFSFARAAWLGLGVGLMALMARAVIKRNLMAQKKVLQAILIIGAVGLILFWQYPNLVMTRLYPVKLLAPQNFFGKQSISHGASNDGVVFNGVNGGQRLEIKSRNERVESIKNSWPIIKNNWASGVGLGNYTLIMRNYECKANLQKCETKFSYNFQPAHNVYLLVLSETGIFGLIFFVGLIIYSLILNFKFKIFNQFKIINLKFKIGENGNAQNATIKLSILTAIIIFLALDHWLWSLHFGVLFFWVVLGFTSRNS